MIADLFPSPVAVIVHDGRSTAIDVVLCEAARRLRAHGLRLGGLVQHNVERDGVDCAQMLLEDLASGTQVDISLRRPDGAKGCRLDASGLAEAAALAARSIAQGVDIALISKFGALEAGGKGLRDEIALAIGAGVPLVTTVSERLLPAWTEFIGEDWTPLPPDPSAIEEWGLAAVAARNGEPTLGA